LGSTAVFIADVNVVFVFTESVLFEPTVTPPEPGFPIVENSPEFVAKDAIEGVLEPIVPGFITAWDRTRLGLFGRRSPFALPLPPLGRLPPLRRFGRPWGDKGSFDMV
jgi:hypothetical protein